MREIIIRARNVLLWNKDLKGAQVANSGSFKKGQVPWNKGLKREGV